MTNFQEIQKATQLLKNKIKRTPLEYSRTFSEMASCDVYLKLENFQTTGSFKVRGAYNKIHHLSAAEKAQGVICSSAGNHAQGVAYAAAKMGIKSTVYMPLFAPPLKIIATKSYGAEVRLEGQYYDEAYLAAKENSAATGTIFVPPFNDEYVIAGQGSLGIEIFEDLQSLDYVFVPVGGGGLISGVAIALKHLKPQIKVIGVEAYGSQSMKLSLEAGKVVSATDVTTIADGIAVKTPGELTFSVVKEYVDEIVTVDDEEIATAVYLLLQRGKTLVEPAGAVSLAAVLQKKITAAQGKNVVCIVSGGNINLGLMAQIVDRGMFSEGLLARISVIIPDKIAVLKSIISILSKLRINIQNISHDRSITSVPVGHVNVIITFHTLGKEQISDTVKELESNNFHCSVLS